MKTLRQTLQDDTDQVLLPTLAKVWKVNISALDNEAALATLCAAMLEPARAEAVWDTLSDDQRGALQMLIGSGCKMPMAMFSRLFGDARKMGTAQIEREKPLQNPANAAEALYYRGLIAQTFEQADTGPRVTVYVPRDLAVILPTRKTSYSNLAQAPGPSDNTLAPLSEVQGQQAADTSLVDDMTTLLVYLRLQTPLLSEGALSEKDRGQLSRFLLKPDLARLNFLFALGESAGLIDVQAGKASPHRVEAPRWLGEARAVQVKALAEAWQKSASYRELWHIPGLQPEPGGELDEYEPVVARENVLELLNLLIPKTEWWSLDEFIGVVKQTEPDFQRPGGDYDSWYIRNSAGEFLQGFESWDAVDGALLEFIITGPLHWLGLADRAEDAARLTAYGRGFFAQTAWPNQADPEDKITLKDDGTLTVSRKISRAERFQIARFTSWISSGDSYIYRLDAAGIQRAGGQGINTAHISSFLSRALGDTPLPKTVTSLLDNWRTGPAASVTLERATVLRTTAPETLERILEAPALRRYLGARLGPMAVVVRAGQQDEMLAALSAAGIQAEWLTTGET